MKNRSDKIELLSSEQKRLMDTKRRDAWKIVLTILLPLIGYYCFEIIPWTGIMYKEWTQASPEEGDLQRENWITGFRLDQRSTWSKTGWRCWGSTIGHYSSLFIYLALFSSFFIMPLFHLIHLTLASAHLFAPPERSPDQSPYTGQTLFTLVSGFVLNR